MDKNKDQGLLEEMVDSLAKKTIDLEKRQVKLEEQGELVKAIVPKINALETSAASYPKVYVPDYSKEFKEISDHLQGHKEAYDNALNGLGEKINALPKVIPVRHEHHFEQKSKRGFIMIIVLILAVAILTGLCIGLGFENSRLADEANKFLILRGFYPEISREIDRAYSVDAENLVRKAQANVLDQQTQSTTKQATKEKTSAARGKRLLRKSAKQSRPKNN